MGFYVQDDMWEALSELPRKTQDEVAGALCRLFFDGEQTPLKGVSKSLFVAFRDRVLLSSKRSESGKQNGKQSEGKRQSKTASKPESETEAKSEPPIKEGEGDKEELPNGSSKKGAFAPPSLAEIEDWAKADGWPVDAAAFKAYYDSNGWKVGRNPMRDWRAAAVSWCRRDGLSRRDPAAKRKEPPACPRCGAPLWRNRQTARWECAACCESFADGDVAEAEGGAR